MSKVIRKPQTQTGRPSKKKTRTPKAPLAPPTANKKPPAASVQPSLSAALDNNEPDDDLQLLAIDPAEIGFVAPERTIKTRLRITGVRQGQPEVLPLDDLDFEIFEV